MPITLKLGELLTAKPALERLGQLRFSITTSYKLARRIKIINESLMRFDAQRAALVRELGSPVKDSPTKVHLRQIKPELLQSAKDEALLKRQDANRATLLFETSLADDEVSKTKAKNAMENLKAQADAADVEVALMEADALAWNNFIAKTNDLMMLDETLSIDPIKLSELQPPEDTICPKCHHSPNEISVEDVMLLFPLLDQEN